MINNDKYVPPTQIIGFLGSEIKRLYDTLRFPQHRLIELQHWLHYTGDTKTTKCHLISLIGKRATRGGGRSFLRRLTDLCTTVRRKHHHATFGSQAREDIRWWSSVGPLTWLPSQLKGNPCHIMHFQLMRAKLAAAVRFMAIGPSRLGEKISTI